MSTLLKRAKEKYLTEFFNENKDIKKTWIGIKSLVSMKHKNNDTPSITRNDEKYINDRIAIANTFSNFSHQLLRLFSQKSSFQTNPSKPFYQQKNNDSFIITTTNQEKIWKVISSLNINKSCGPNSIPTKIYT